MHDTSIEALHAFARLSPDAVLVVDGSGQVRIVNDAAASLFRTDVERLVGEPLEMLVPAEHRASHRRRRESYQEQPTTRRMGSEMQLWASALDGTRVPVDVGLRPVVVGGERLVVAVVRDLTDRRQAEQATNDLERAATRLRQFVDVASHELRTPLTAVLGFAETLLSHVGFRADDRTRELLEAIRRNALRQERLLNGLLELSRLQRGQLRLCPEVVSVHTVVHEAVDSFPGLDIEVEVGAESRVVADPQRVVQILVDLLINAERYGAAPVRITEVPSGHEQVLLAISDGGEGIPESYRHEMFAPFTQASNGDAREAEGLGLGLHLARSLALAMGGDLSYVPDERQGSRFLLLMPRGAAITAHATARLGERSA